MPRGKHLRIVIGVDGACAVDAVNFTGPACQVATMEIAALLGNRISSQHDKPEIRMRETDSQAQPEQSR